MVKQYSAEFKMQAVKRVETTGGPVSKVAAELGINENTLHGWLKKYREKPNTPRIIYLNLAPATPSGSGWGVHFGYSSFPVFQAKWNCKVSSG